MGIFTFLSISKSDTSSKSKTNKHHGHSSSKKSNSKSKRHSTGTSDTVVSSSSSSLKTGKTNVDIITEYVAALNAHASVEELVSKFASPDTKNVFEDDMVMPAVGLVTEIRKCYLGFEDLTFNYESIKEVKPGKILVEELVVTGTHTKDFGFGNFPVIPATHRYVILDAERLWFTMKDGKIQKQEITALGNLTGPPGMYIAVGGKMEMPLPVDS